MNRKEFVKTGGLAAAAMVFAPSVKLFATAPEQKVKLAIIGVGGRGQSHLDLVLRRDDVDLVAICDIEPHAIENSKSIINKSGKKMPQIFTGV